MLYFPIALDRITNRTGRHIRFLAEVPVSVAKMTAKSPEDEPSIDEESKRLAGKLISRAMSGSLISPEKTTVDFVRIDSTGNNR